MKLVECLQPTLAKIDKRLMVIVVAACKQDSKRDHTQPVSDISVEFARHHLAQCKACQTNLQIHQKQLGSSIVQDLNNILKLTSYLENMAAHGGHVSLDGVFPVVSPDSGLSDFIGCSG